MPSDAETCVQSTGSPLRELRASLHNCRSTQTSLTHHRHLLAICLGPPSIRVHTLMKDVHDYDEWKRDLCHSIVLHCNEQWSWDFTQVPIVPECLFQPAERPPCPDSGFWFRGCQHSEPHEVPDLTSMSDPWEVPLSTVMPCDVLWSYLAFHVMSVSDILSISCLLALGFPVSCHPLTASCGDPLTNSLPFCFQLHCQMSQLSEHAHQDRDWLIGLWDVSNSLGVEAHFEALWKKLEFPSSLELFPPTQPALNIWSCGSGLENSIGV